MATQFSGGPYVNTTFTGAVRSDLQSNIRTQLVNAGWTSVAVASGQGVGNVGTFTITIATPGVITWGAGAHGFLGGERVILQTTGALPTGLSVNTVYFVKFINTTTFNLATTLGGANINTTGSQSGVHTLNTESMLLQSATHANITNPIRVRIKDNRGNCAMISIENSAGTVVGTNSTVGGALLPAAAKVFRIVASQYQFFCFKTAAQVAREFVMAGMLYIPSTVITGITDHGYMHCDSASDSDGTLRPNLRLSMNMSNPNGGPFSQLIWNGSIYDLSTTSPSPGGPTAVFLYPFDPNNNGSNAHYRWANDYLNSSDVYLSQGLTTSTDEGKIKGQFFDMVYIPTATVSEVTDTFNGHNWINITNNNAGTGTQPSGGVWIATS